MTAPVCSSLIARKEFIDALDFDCHDNVVRERRELRVYRFNAGI
jgi:hypothetical protein